MINKNIVIFLVLISVLFLGIFFGFCAGRSAKDPLNDDNMVIKNIKMINYPHDKGGDIYVYTFFDKNIVFTSKHKYNIGDTLHIKK